MNRTLYIYFHDAYTPDPVLVGTLASQLLRNSGVSWFSNCQQACSNSGSEVHYYCTF